MTALQQALNLWLTGGKMTRQQRRQLVHQGLLTYDGQLSSMGIEYLTNRAPRSKWEPPKQHGCALPVSTQIGRHRVNRMNLAVLSAVMLSDR